ncbi:MAG TPA: hypothetical protein VK468_09685 [Pyrinomonadaceae bacterium]|nr:hypothetical protein [Pyrinomonadaceae bacterium]
MKLRWRFGIIAGVFLAIFCLYPQGKMLYLRGDAWNGHYAYNDIDEVAYASYVRALIDGRPRRNDPYSGADDTAEEPQPESLFSIQFAAPYTIALPARLLGVGTPWAMILSGALAGFLAALAGFWLVGRFTGNSWYAMASALVIFAGGALAAGEGALPEILFDGFSYPYFPGFRRYIPAMAMPAIFGLFALMWRLLERRLAPDLLHPEITTTPSAEAAATPPKHGGESEKNPNPQSAIRDPQSRNAGGAYMIAAAACFAYCVFSYFYIWTTAAAWLGILGVVWILFRPEGFRRDLKTLAAVGAGCAAALVPYAYLLSNRSHTMDDVQLLVLSHAPDLARVPEYISIVCLVLLAAGVVNGMFGLRERSTLFALSTALVPLVVFNQQVITGRSLQPIHYQVFIGNYVAGLALMLTIGLLLRRQLAAGRAGVKAASAVLAMAAVMWGFVECHYTVRVLDDANVERDIALPVARRLEELGRASADPHRETVLSFDGIFADDLPSVAPQNVLWARHQHVFAGLTWQQNKERYYRYLYFCGVDEGGLDHLLKNDFVSQIALFGWGRHSDRLSVNSKPLTYREIAEEVRNYGRFVENFDAKTAAEPLLSYVVVNDEADTDLSVVDQWYERYDPEFIGKYTIYRVRPRTTD